MILRIRMITAGNTRKHTAASLRRLQLPTPRPLPTRRPDVSVKGTQTYVIGITVAAAAKISVSV